MLGLFFQIEEVAPCKSREISSLPQFMAQFSRTAKFTNMYVIDIFTMKRIRQCGFGKSRDAALRKLTNIQHRPNTRSFNFLQEC